MLSNRLKELRSQKKKTQKEIAAFLGITRQGYGNYENGVTEPDTETIQKLADFFGVSTDYLLGRTDDPTPPGGRVDNDEDENEHFFFSDGGEDWTEEEIEIARQAAKEAARLAAKAAVEAYRRGKKIN